VYICVYTEETWTSNMDHKSLHLTIIFSKLVYLCYSDNFSNGKQFRSLTFSYIMFSFTSQIMTQMKTTSRSPAQAISTAELSWHQIKWEGYQNHHSSELLMS
jgi:hypothetical protein